MDEQTAEIDVIVTATLDALARRTGGVLFREDSDVADWIRRQRPGLLLDLRVFPPGCICAEPLPRGTAPKPCPHHGWVGSPPGEGA